MKQLDLCPPQKPPRPALLKWVQPLPGRISAQTHPIRRLKTYEFV